MGVQPSELKAMTLWEYEALLSRWNKAHALPEDEAPIAPVEEFQRMEQYFMDHPELLN